MEWHRERFTEMNSRWREILITGLMLLLFGLSVWLVNAPATTPASASRGADIQPAHVMHQFVTRTYGSDGHLSQHLEGEQIMYFGTAQETLVEAPYIITYQHDQPHWYGRAEHGQLSADGTEIQLLGATRLWQPAGETSAGGVEIVTRDVLLRSQDGYVATDEYAVLRSDRAVTEGKGLQAFTHAGQVRILADVKSVLRPATDHPPTP